MDTLDRTFVFLLDPCSLVFGSCTQPLTRLAGGRFVCCAGKLRGSHLPVKTLGCSDFVSLQPRYPAWTNLA